VDLSGRPSALYPGTWSGWNGVPSGLQSRGFPEDGTKLPSEWVAHTPPEVSAKNTGLDKSVFAQTPGAPLYIFPGNPPNSLEQDKAEIGGEQVASRNQYTFHLKSMESTKASKAGEVRIVDSRNFPASKHIAAALVTVKPGGLCELHWHPNSSEWQFYIAGKARITVFFPVDNARTMDFNANDVGYVHSMPLTISRTRATPTWSSWKLYRRQSSAMFR
jgi:oxalate decarboxylase